MFNSYDTCSRSTTAYEMLFIWVCHSLKDSMKNIFAVGKSPSWSRVIGYKFKVPFIKIQPWTNPCFHHMSIKIFFQHRKHCKVNILTMINLFTVLAGFFTSTKFHWALLLFVNSLLSLDLQRSPLLLMVYIVLNLTCTPSILHVLFPRRKVLLPSGCTIHDVLH